MTWNSSAPMVAGILPNGMIAALTHKNTSVPVQMRNKLRPFHTQVLARYEPVTRRLGSGALALPDQLQHRCALDRAGAATLLSGGLFQPYPPKRSLTIVEFDPNPCHT